MPSLLMILALISQFALSSSVSAADAPAPQFLKTPDGVDFAIWGEKPTSPSPTLVMFAADMNGTLTNIDNNTIAILLKEKGFVVVALDVPCHGRDAQSGESSGDLGAWRTRIEKGQPLMQETSHKTSRVLNHLIAEGYSDPLRLVVSGTSRGGFTAFHVAAAEPRFKYVIGFAPVTHLPTLAEFSGTSSNPAVLEYSAIHLAPKLADRSVWIAIGNNDVRVGTDDCLDFVRELVKHSSPKNNPVPVELHLLATINHRLHANPALEFRQTYAPHRQAADWLLAELKLNEKLPSK